MNQSAHWHGEMKHVYQIPPIDIFLGMQTAKEYITELVEFEIKAKSQGLEYDTFDGLNLNDFLDKLSSAAGLAARAGWEGELRHGVFVFFLPADGMCSVGFVFKQDNNGTTFVVTEVPLDYLGVEADSMIFHRN